MCGSAKMALVVAAMLLAPAPAAQAQALVLDPGDIATGGAGPRARDSESTCPTGTPVLCGANAVTDVVGDLAGAGASAVGSAAMGGMTAWASEGAAWIVGQIAQQIERSTRPDLGSAWFQERYRSVRDLALALSALFLLAAIAHAVVRQDAAMLLRSVLVALPLAMLLTFAAVTLVESALALTDWMTAVVLQQLDRDTRSAFGDLARFLRPAEAASGGPPGFLTFVAAVLTALLSLVVWIELVLREAAIYVAVAFLPLTFVAMVWNRTAHWSRRLAEWLTGVILAKFTIACAFAVAASALANARGAGGGLSAVLAGCAVLLVAALSPWVLLRLIPIGTDAVLQRGHVRAALGGAPGAGTTSAVGRQLLLSRVRTAGGGGPVPVLPSAPSLAGGRQRRPPGEGPLPSSRSFPERGQAAPAPARDRAAGDPDGRPRA